jgi:hypothetical protein
MYQQSVWYEIMWQWLGSGGQLVQTPQFQELDGGVEVRRWGEVAVKDTWRRAGWEVGASRGCRRGEVAGLERYWGKERWLIGKAQHSGAVVYKRAWTGVLAEGRRAGVGERTGRELGQAASKAEARVGQS